MCGILAAFNTKVEDKKNKKKGKDIKAETANEFIINQYEDQFSRGTEGFGILRIDKKGKIELDRACEPVKFMIDLYMKQSDMIIAHHRTPTASGNYIDQTHPIFVSNEQLNFDYYVIHNGIISNDTELLKKHKELGFEYTTAYNEKGQWENSPKKLKFNDSECLAIEVALFIENKINAIGLNNAAAFIVLQIDKEKNLATKVFYGKNGISSDLNMSKTRGELRISSIGKGNPVKENILYSFDINDPSMNLKSKKIPFIERKAPVIIPDHIIPKNLNNNTKETTTPKLITQQSLTTTEEKDLKENLRPIRTIRRWVDMELLNDCEDFIEGPDKNYPIELLEEVKIRLKGEESTSTSSIIDDILDEKIDQIKELIDNFKTILLTDKLETGEKAYFIEKINFIMSAMIKVTDWAEDDFTEKVILEQEAEKDETQIGFIPKRREMHLKEMGIGIYDDIPLPVHKHGYGYGINNEF